MKYLISTIVLLIFGGVLWQFYTPGELLEKESSFVLPTYLRVASTTNLTEEQIKMISVYDQARINVVADPTTIKSFIDFLHTTTTQERQDLLQSDNGLSLRLENASGVAVETYSDYKYLFPPYLSYDNKATILKFVDNTMWLLEHTSSSQNGTTTFGYRVSDITFVEVPGDTYKIAIRKIGDTYSLEDGDIAYKMSDGTPINMIEIPRTTTFQTHPRFVKAGDIAQTTPMEVREALEKVEEYYQEISN